MRFGSGMNAVQSLSTSGVQTCRSCSAPCSSAAAGSPVVTAQGSVTVAARAAAATALQIFDMGSLPPYGDKRRSPSVPLFLGAHLLASVRSIVSTSHAAAIAWPVVPDVSLSGTCLSFACCRLRSSRSPAASSMFGRRRAPRCPDGCEIGRQGLRLLDRVPRAAHRNRSANM
jgi:hypothetical protein